MSTIDLELLQCFCDEAADSLTEWEALCLTLEQDHGNDVLNKLFRFAHNIKGASRAVGLAELGEFVHKVEDVITAVRDGSLPFEERHTTLFLEAQGILSEWIRQIRSNPTAVVGTEVIQFKVQEMLGGVTTKSEAKGDTAHEEPLSPEIVQALNELEGTPPTVDSVPQKQVEVAKAPAAPAAGPAKGTSSHPDETVRVSANRLDQLIQVIGELSIHQSILWHARSLAGEEREKAYSNSINMGRKLTKELYEKALGLRMQPVQSLFQRLERNIKDLARDLEKKVQVQTAGTEVELDKTVLEKIVDPLIHIVRNSVDHGIESKDQIQSRLEKGKPETGTVKISAIQDSDGVVITVEDDGKGLNRERILKKAIEKGLINANAEMADAEILNLIFLPGFSTAEKVTSISGRGVGMDVVMKAVEALSGRVSITSEEGKGSKFTVQLPTSLSILDALIVEVDYVSYAVPIHQIDEILNKSELSFNADQKMLSFRGKVIPYRHLSDFIPKQGSKRSGDQNQAVLMVRNGREMLSFGVQRIIGQQQIVVRHLQGGLGKIFGFSGGTILATGEPGLIVDLSAISQKHLELLERAAA